jgi:hypothetical protein
MKKKEQRLSALYPVIESAFGLFTRNTYKTTVSVNVVLKPTCRFCIKFRGKLYRTRLHNIQQSGYFPNVLCHRNKINILDVVRVGQA